MFNTRYLQLFALGVIFSGVITSLETAHAQFIPNDIGFEMRHRANHNATIDLLPQRVSHKENEVSVVVDFDSAENNRVDVFIVNDSNDDFRFQRKTLGLPIVLEVDLGDGQWDRAEIRNDIASYSSFNANELVLNGHFRKRKCRYWTSGEPATLRYSLYKDGKPVLESASFEGFLPMGKVHSARRDMMAASLTPDVLKIRYQVEETTFKEVRDEWVPKLTLLYQLGPAHIELEEFQRWTSDIHSNPVSTRSERDLAIQLQTRMLNPWPSEYNLGNLYQYCVDTVIARTTETRAIRHVCWQLLNETTKDNKALVDPTLPKIAWQSLQASSGNDLRVERKEMSRFLCSSVVTRTDNPLDLLDNHQALVKSDDPYIRIVAANWFLSQKYQTSDFNVMDYYESTPPTDLGIYELIEILHLNRIYNSKSKRRWGLWLQALEKDPAYTISNLALIYDFDKRDFRKKFKSSEDDIPNTIKSRLLEHANSDSDSETGMLAKKILDFNNRKRSSRLRLNF